MSCERQPSAWSDGGACGSSPSPARRPGSQQQAPRQPATHLMQDHRLLLHMQATCAPARRPGSRPECLQLSPAAAQSRELPPAAGAGGGLSRLLRAWPSARRRQQQQCRQHCAAAGGSRSQAADQSNRAEASTAWRRPERPAGNGLIGRLALSALGRQTIGQGSRLCKTPPGQRHQWPGSHCTPSPGALHRAPQT